MKAPGGGRGWSPKEPSRLTRCLLRKRGLLAVSVPATWTLNRLPPHKAHLQTPEWGRRNAGLKARSLGCLHKEAHVMHDQMKLSANTVNFFNKRRTGKYVSFRPWGPITWLGSLVPIAKALALTLGKSSKPDSVYQPVKWENFHLPTYLVNLEHTRVSEIQKSFLKFKSLSALHRHSSESTMKAVA